MSYSTLDWFVCLLSVEAEAEEGEVSGGNGLVCKCCFHDNFGDATAWRVLNTLEGREVGKLEWYSDTVEEEGEDTEGFAEPEWFWDCLKEEGGDSGVVIL